MPQTGAPAGRGTVRQEARGQLQQQRQRERNQSIAWTTLHSASTKPTNQTRLVQFQGRPAADKTEAVVAPQQIGEGRRRCLGKKQGETRSTAKPQRAQTKAGFKKSARNPHSQSEKMVLTCLTDSHPARTKK